MSIAYERRGAGPALVLLHPLGTDRHVWHPVLDRLAERHDVIALDLPGFGESPALDGPVHPRDLADAVAAFLREQGIERPYVAGNSHGGWIALELALAGVASRVTAIAPAGLWARPLAPKRGAGRAFARVALPLLPRLARSPRWRAILLSASVAHPERVPAGEAEHMIRAYATAPGMRATNDAMRASRFEDLARIEVPVTLGWPELDRLVARPRTLPPNVRSVVLRDCGHIPMWDDPAQVVALIESG